MVVVAFLKGNLYDKGQGIQVSVLSIILFVTKLVIVINIKLKNYFKDNEIYFTN